MEPGGEMFQAAYENNLATTIVTCAGAGFGVGLVGVSLTDQDQIFSPKKEFFPWMRAANADEMIAQHNRRVATELSLLSADVAGLIPEAGIVP